MVINLNMVGQIVSGLATAAALVACYIAGKSEAQTRMRKAGRMWAESMLQDGATEEDLRRTFEPSTKDFDMGIEDAIRGYRVWDDDSDQPTVH